MPERPTITQIENAFLPSKEITDAKRFAGRSEAIQGSHLGLIAEGSNIAIVGNRGVGKTSLAQQVLNMGTGNSEILEKLNIPFDNTLDFLSFYFTCGKTTESIESLLEKLITNSNCLADWIYDVPKATKALSSYQPKFSAKVLQVGVELGGTKSTETTTEPVLQAHPIDVVFTNIVNAINDQKLSKNGLLFVIDEFDQIKDRTGFASFLKALATNAPNVKFCIVGVASDIYELMNEHASSDRLFAGSIIPLKAMEDDELSEIIENAETMIDSYIVFDNTAKIKLIKLAQGHPYMVHLVGKFALRHAFQQDNRSVLPDDIDKAMADIASRGADPVLEGRYKKAITSSVHRELVLKALAETKNEDNEVWTNNAYKLAIDWGVDNPSQYVGQLVIDTYGAEIVNVRDRFYKFKDSLFAAYVKARPRYFQQV